MIVGWVGYTGILSLHTTYTKLRSVKYTDDSTHRASYTTMYMYNTKPYQPLDIVGEPTMVHPLPCICLFRW